MKKIFFALLVSICVFLTKSDNIFAIEYGYVSQEYDNDSCYRHKTFIYDEAGNATSATSFREYIYNSDTWAVVYDSGALSNVTTHNSPCLNTSILNLFIHTKISKSGYGGELEWEFWNGSNSQNTSGGVRNNIASIQRLYLTPQKTETLQYPVGDQMITTKTITARFFADPYSNGDIDVIWLDYSYLNPTTGAWDWIPLPGPYGSEGSPLNLNSVGGGVFNAPTVTIPNPLDGYYNWILLYLDQDPPIITNIWQSRVSRYLGGDPGEGYFYLATDLNASTPTINGTISPGSNLTFSSIIRNIGADIIARASTARFRIDLNNDGIWDTTLGTRSVNQLNPAATQTITSPSWTAVNGVHRIEVCADYNAVLIDINRGNNCTTTTFTVGTPSPTPSLTRTPTPTPTRTPTPTVTRTPTPSPTPITNLSCNSVCTGSSQCASGYCYLGACRNVSCPSATNCTCTAPTFTPSPTFTRTPTPTVTRTPTPSPTPITNLSCNSVCTGSSQCASGFCYLGACRNSACSTVTNCICPIATATPTSSPTPTACVSSCSVLMSPNLGSTTVSQTTQFEAVVSSLNTCGNTVSVDFSTSNSGIASISPLSDSTIRYQTTATGVSAGTSTIQANVRIGGVVRCTSSANLTVGALSCNFNLLPASLSLTSLGASQTLTVSNITGSSGMTIDRVDFSSSDALVASVNPLTKSTPTYSTDVSPGTQGSATVTADMFINGSTAPVCSDTSTIDVTGVDPWWQAMNTGVMTNGTLASVIPTTCTSSAGCDNSLITYDATGQPGVLSAGSYSPSLSASENPPFGWNSQSTYRGAAYSFDYFEKKSKCAPLNDIPTGTTTIDTAADLIGFGPPQDGYYWVRYDHGASSPPLTIDGDLQLGTNKVVLFVKNADLHINGKIQVTDGQGFFMVIADRNIVVDPVVGGLQENPAIPDLEGVFFTDQNLRTGTTGTTDLQLHMRGSVAAFESIILERNLADNTTTPSELFEYGPDQLLLLPQCIAEQSISWTELAP